MDEIELDLSNVGFSKNDIKRGIQIPKFLYTDLCYETGLHIGDENLSIKKYASFKLDINGDENLEKWLKNIGFSSTKHLVKLDLWKKIGFCKPFLSYTQRQNLLNASVAQLVER
jgi:hypothetical protein